ncbi:alpha/beta hydrolase [Marinomonas sp. 2405UD66-6]|uniref:alpha/beta hydrolase n=1 Tax=Marinomonas sp. 2405UD66-6 TaxID=3391834 RepID=UPI0039C98736
MWKGFIFWCAVFMVLPAYAEKHEHFVFKPDEVFSDYVARAETYLQANKVWVNADNQIHELAAVMPFELLPDASRCDEDQRVGVLLSHGLSDSPFSMRDPARALQAACYHVRVILLPGHGTESASLLSVSREDWRETFYNAANQLKEEVDSLYVGGFSTGGALAAEYAWKNPDQLSGVLLFSPVFKVNSSIDWLSPWLALVKDWLDNEPSDDFAKYASIPVPAIAEVYKLAKEVRGFVLENPKELPVFIAMSDEDQTVDSSVTLEVFEQGMVGATSQISLYSQDQNKVSSDRVKVYNSHWPESNILGLSHMAVHGAPNNPYYGAFGEYRICGWYLSDKALYDACRTDESNWFGERSKALSEKSPHAARVSWNPEFASLMQEMVTFMRSNTLQN